ncbi:winged helix-turn-helix transcriptional regulator [Pedobacter terrae]|uniref:winged helix-turn-helix transcriptional regulator n=1 Tax=Pedobacter terrae TaxID=405671 RepID=UPI00373FCA58
MSGSFMRLIFIGGNWASVFCSWLINGKLRFDELKKLLPNITEPMLTLAPKTGRKQNC